MTRLADIPIRVEAAQRDASDRTGTIGGGVVAILAEIATALERLGRGADSTAIDLRSLPLSDADHTRLIDALGPGELRIELSTDGSVQIRETDVHGVWWNEYRDRDGQVTAAFIEVAHVPSIVVVESDELQQGAERLRAKISTGLLAPFTNQTVIGQEG